MTILADPDAGMIKDVLDLLDRWETETPNREIDCRIAFALGHNWFDETGDSWREWVGENGFKGAWLFPPVAAKSQIIPHYTSSYDAIFAEMERVMPRIDDIHISTDPSGSSANCGVWHLSAPYDPLENDGEHVPYIWPNGKCYNSSPLLALLGSFLMACIQQVRGDPFPKAEVDAPTA